MASAPGLGSLARLGFELGPGLGVRLGVVGLGVWLGARPPCIGFGFGRAFGVGLRTGFGVVGSGLRLGLSFGCGLCLRFGFGLGLAFGCRLCLSLGVRLGLGFGLRFGRGVRL